MLTEEQRLAVEALSNPDDINSPQNAVVLDERYLWSNARVPYILDGSLDSSARRAIQQAVNEYAMRTCVRFVPRTNERDYVRFYRGSGCVVTPCMVIHGMHTCMHTCVHACMHACMCMTTTACGLHNYTV